MRLYAPHAKIETCWNMPATISTWLATNISYVLIHMYLAACGVNKN